MARWLGIDHGHKRIGIAAGDAETRIASPLETIAADHPDPLGAILQLAGEYDAAGLVVGWPLNADGTEGAQGRLARGFAAELADRTDLDVRLWDETLSSFEADRKLRGQWTRKKRRARQDAVAAAAFLEDFLNCGGDRTAPRPADVDN